MVSCFSFSILDTELLTLEYLFAVRSGVSLDPESLASFQNSLLFYSLCAKIEMTSCVGFSWFELRFVRIHHHPTAHATLDQSNYLYIFTILILVIFGMVL